MGAFGEERDRDHALLMKLSSLFLMGLAHGQDLAFEDVFDHTCDATTMYATIRKADLAQLGTWKDNFEMVTLNKVAPAKRMNMEISFSLLDHFEIFHSNVEPSIQMMVLVKSPSGMWCNIHHQMTHQSHEMHLAYTISVVFMICL